MPRYTVDDLDAFPDDDQHYELLDGILLVTPAPARLHQDVIARLVRGLLQALPPECGIDVAFPGRIQVGRHVRLEPDILVYPRPADRKAEWPDLTSWMLAVEVLSPSTRVYDTQWKRQAYQAIGVEEVWLVDPETERISSYLGTSSEPRIATERLVWTPHALSRVPIEIEVRALFR